MKYLKLFKTDVDYQNYIESDGCVKPNVSYLHLIGKDLRTLPFSMPVCLRTYFQLSIYLI